jgi:hypothetical protein
MWASGTAPILEPVHRLSSGSRVWLAPLLVPFARDLAVVLRGLPGREPPVRASLHTGTEYRALLAARGRVPPPETGTGHIFGVGNRPCGLIPPAERTARTRPSGPEKGKCWAR